MVEQTRVQKWVRDIVELQASKPRPVVGARWVYSGKSVEITGGKFWGLNGVSNFWDFRYVNPDGSLGEPGGAYDNNRTRFHPKGVSVEGQSQDSRDT